MSEWIQVYLRFDSYRDPETNHKFKGLGGKENGIYCVLVRKTLCNLFEKLIEGL